MEISLNTSKLTILPKLLCLVPGFPFKNGLSNASPEEYLVKKSVIENSTIRFALADHSKFGNFSLMTFCPFEDIDHVLTDQLPGKEFCNFAKLHSIKIETP